MIAEIYGKISSSGSNLSDRLEDKLTGDFFGALRYLPFEIGIRHVLVRTQFESRNEGDAWQQFLKSRIGFDHNLEFWVRQDEGEIDILLDCPDILIGIEVKYRSGLSSEDEGDEANLLPEESRDQLVRYSRMLARLRGTRQAYLVFLAPENLLNPVRRERAFLLESIRQDFGENYYEKALNAVQKHIDYYSRDSLMRSNNAFASPGFNIPTTSQYRIEAFKGISAISIVEHRAIPSETSREIPRPHAEIPG